MYPIKLKVKTEIIPVALILLNFILAVWSYPKLAPLVPTHWNFSGQIDGWSSAGFAAFFFPSLVLAIYVLFLVLPVLDPKKERYADFEKVFHVLKISLVALLSGIFWVIIASGLGYDLPVDKLVPMGIGFLFMVIGNYLGKVRSNWLIGIRTPWTLSSEEVWNKTHRVGGRSFVVAGIIMFFEGLLPLYLRTPSFIFILALAVLYPIVYSYILFKKEKKAI